MATMKAESEWLEVARSGCGRGLRVRHRYARV